MRYLSKLSYNWLFFRSIYVLNRGKRCLRGGRRSTDPREIRSYCLVRMLYMCVIYLSVKNKVSIQLLNVKYVYVNVMIMAAAANVYVTPVADLSPLVAVFLTFIWCAFMMCVSINKVAPSDQRFLISWFVWSFVERYIVGLEVVFGWKDNARIGP